MGGIIEETRLILRRVFMKKMLKFFGLMILSVSLLVGVTSCGKLIDKIIEAVEEETDDDDDDSQTSSSSQTGGDNSYVYYFDLSGTTKKEIQNMNTAVSKEHNSKLSSAWYQLRNSIKPYSNDINKNSGRFMQEYQEFFTIMLEVNSSLMERYNKLMKSIEKDAKVVKKRRK